MGKKTLLTKLLVTVREKGNDLVFCLYTISIMESLRGKLHQINEMLSVEDKIFTNIE